MKKLVISGSAKLQKEIEEFVSKIKGKFEIIDYPKEIKGDFFKNYPKTENQFLSSIGKADAFLLFNEDKQNIKGYIGYASFGELRIALYLKLIQKKDVDVYIYKMPDKAVACYDEISLWLNLGWIKIFKA